MTSTLATRVGGLRLINPVICGSGEPVMTEAGIRAALRAGAAGVIAKSVNERPEAAVQLDIADYAWEGESLLCRSGLISASGRGLVHLTCCSGPGSGARWPIRRGKRGDGERERRG